MSLLRKARRPAVDVCRECKPGEVPSTFRLLIEPINNDIRSEATHDAVVQLANADRLQQLFVPMLSRVEGRVHGDGYHMHPDQPEKVGHIGQMHAMMEPHDLIARLSFTPDREQTAVTASLTNDHVQELVANGAVDVEVPLGQGTFRLHSTRVGRVTAVEYLAR